MARNDRWSEIGLASALPVLTMVAVQLGTVSPGRLGYLVAAWFTMIVFVVATIAGLSADAAKDAVW